MLTSSYNCTMWCQLTPEIHLRVWRSHILTAEGGETTRP